VIEAEGDQIVVVPAGVPHKFVNSGTGQLRQVDIHPSGRFITVWLEDGASHLMSSAQPAPTERDICASSRRPC
jgi:hypothetical protein